MHKRFGKHVYKIDLNDPKTFNEKITWLKLNYRFGKGNIIADKYLVREYIKKKIGADYLIPLINVYDSADEINFDNLPDQFVLKPNHGSGWVIICEDKESADIEAYRKKLNYWMSLDFEILSGEWQYSGIKKRILCEELIQELKNVVDYKFYCFNGRPRCVQVDFDRHTKHTRSFYDIGWNKMDLSLLYPPGEKEMQKPTGLDEMVEVAITLSKGFPFCRVDLYDVNGKIYFGEITLHPEAGVGPFGSYEQDLIMGNMLNIEDLMSK